MEHIKLTNISFVYEKNSPPALSEIDFSVQRGETLCIAGANGCGKSTLLQIIAGVLKPASGEVCITQNTGIVFQEVDHQLFMPTVWEDVAFGVLKKGMKPQEAREAAFSALRNIDAEHLAEKPPHKLSGGEKQRAALAGILITEPEILVLDEPSAALDPRARKNLIALLREIKRTKIIASHDLDLILDIADKVLFLNKGKIAAYADNPAQALNNEHFLKSIGLELPLCHTPH